MENITDIIKIFKSVEIKSSKSDKIVALMLMKFLLSSKQDSNINVTNNIFNQL